MYQFQFNHIKAALDVDHHGVLIRVTNNDDVYERVTSSVYLACLRKMTDITIQDDHAMIITPDLSFYIPKIIRNTDRALAELDKKIIKNTEIIEELTKKVAELERLNQARIQTSDKFLHMNLRHIATFNQVISSQGSSTFTNAEIEYSIDGKSFSRAMITNGKLDTPISAMYVRFWHEACPIDNLGTPHLDVLFYLQ